MNRNIPKSGNQNGFSLLELIVAMTLTLILLTAAASLFGTALGIRERESRRTAALALAQTSLNIMSREIANAGFGLTDNGIVLTDSDQKRLHFRTNAVNNNTATDSAGEDVTYYFDSASRSIHRYDRFNNPQNSIVIAEMSDLNFQYFDYENSSTPSVNNAPSAKTGRIRITLTINLPANQTQPALSVTHTTDVTLRNSTYILKNY